MSATLPPIINPPRLPSQEYSGEKEKNKPLSSKSRFLIPIKKVCSKQERDILLRLQDLRAQQPDLTKPETSIYRNSYIHTLYLDMLQAGFHQSFSELFALIKQQKEAREYAGPDSVLWNQIHLENEHDKLEQLKQHLTKAEAADREGIFIEVYDAQFTLARYFLSTDDKWLSDHFFTSCLRTCLSAPDEKRKLAEAYCNMGLAVEQAGGRYQAASHFESFHELAECEDWQNDEDVKLHHLACTHLTRIYTSIAGTLGPIDITQFLEYLLKAHERAKESCDKKLEGEASYKLGLGYEKNKEYGKALFFLKSYYAVCKSLGDNHGLGLACEAIARSYEKQGNIEECIKHLQLFVEVAEKSGLEKDVSRACSDLGAVYNSLSRYQEAAEYFTKAFNISRSLNDKEAISASRVQYGIAIGHRMLSNTSIHIEQRTKPCIETLIVWKSARQNAFENTPTEQATPNPAPTPQPEPEESRTKSPQSGSAEASEETTESQAEGQVEETTDQQTVEADH